MNTSSIEPSLKKPCYERILSRENASFEYQTRNKIGDDTVIFEVTNSEGRKIKIINLHTSNTAKKLLSQIENLRRDFIQECDNDTTIVITGDFNARIIKQDDEALFIEKEKGDLLAKLNLSDFDWEITTVDSTTGKVRNFTAQLGKILDPAFAEIDKALVLRRKNSELQASVNQLITSSAAVYGYNGEIEATTSTFAPVSAISDHALLVVNTVVGVVLSMNLFGESVDSEFKTNIYEMFTPESYAWLKADPAREEKFQEIFLLQELKDEEGNVICRLKDYKGTKAKQKEISESTRPYDICGKVFLPPKDHRIDENNPFYQQLAQKYQIAYDKLFNEEETTPEAKATQDQARIFGKALLQFWNQLMNDEVLSEMFVNDYLIHKAAYESNQQVGRFEDRTIEQIVHYLEMHQPAFFNLQEVSKRHYEFMTNEPFLIELYRLGYTLVAPTRFVCTDPNVNANKTCGATIVRNDYTLKNFNRNEYTHYRPSWLNTPLEAVTIETSLEDVSTDIA